MCSFDLCVLVFIMAWLNGCVSGVEFGGWWDDIVELPDLAVDDGAIALFYHGMVPLLLLLLLFPLSLLLLLQLLLLLLLFQLPFPLLS